jgi:hypothetical protein
MDPGKTTQRREEEMRGNHFQKQSAFKNISARREVNG